MTHENWRGAAARPAIVAAALIGLSGGSAIAAAFDDIEGLWRSRGYGYIASIAAGEFRLIEYTQSSCVLAARYSPDSLAERYKLESSDPSAFSLQKHGFISVFEFDRTDEAGFEEACPNGPSNDDSDPVLNFEALWKTFDEHYAFFDARGVDWNAAYETYRPQINASSSEDDLKRVVDEMLRSLGDAHVWVWTDSDFEDSIGGNDQPFDALLRAECRAAGACDDEEDEEDYIEEQTDRLTDIIEEDYLDDELEYGLNDRFSWGLLTPDIGYLRITQMFDLRRFWTSAEDDIERATPLIEDVLYDLDDPDGLVIDVRINDGGHDAVALALAGAFFDETMQVGSKRSLYRGLDGERRETEATPLIVEPVGEEPFEGDVVILIGPESYSAAEILAMALRDLPNVTLVGQNTHGVLSDNFFRTLPNGWVFSLSNEAYLDRRDVSFEAIGVPPDVEAPFFPKEDRERGRDSALDKAIELLSAE